MAPAPFLGVHGIESRVAGRERTYLFLGEIEGGAIDCAGALQGGQFKHRITQSITGLRGSGRRSDDYAER